MSGSSRSPTGNAGTGTPGQLSIAEALHQAHTHWDAGQADQAEMLCQRVLAAWPGQADALHLLGLMAHAYGNLDLAIAQLRQACQAPRAPAVYFSNLAEMCRQKGLLAEGEQAARRAVAMNNTLPGAWNNLGIILQETGKLEESRLCLQRVLTLQPDNAEAHNNLGNTCKRLGLLDQAQQCWSRALALRPSYAEPHSNLAHLLVEQNEFDRAAEHARQAIDLSPQLADAYINLALAEAARGRHGEALRWLDSMLTFAPLHPAGLAAKALALQQLDRLDEALDHAERAVAASPGSAEAQNALGTVLQALGRVEAALAAYDRAAALPGSTRERAMVNRAMLLVEQRRRDAARHALDEALLAFPQSAGIRFNRARLERFTPGDPSIAAMQALLAPGGLQSPNDRMLLHFALGKAFLETGDSDLAFHHLHEGNRFKRASLGYDPAATSAGMAAIAGTFTPALMQRLGGQGAASALPVFVLGMPCSGTTQVERILASHPALQGAGALPHVARLVEGLGGYPAAVAGLAPEQLAALGAAYLTKVVPLAAGRQHVIDSMPANFLHAGLLHLTLPEARIIHCRRDPVDTCLACYGELFTEEQAFAYDLSELGRFHRAYQALMAHWRAVLPASRFIEVDYEALLTDGATEARRLLDFLGLPWHPACRVDDHTQLAASTTIGPWRQHAGKLRPLLEALDIREA